MDTWLVSTLAAAGYLSKYWQNITKQEDMSSQRSNIDSKFVNHESSDHRLAQKKALRKDEQKYLDMNCLDVASITDLASENGLVKEKLQALDKNQYLNTLPISNLPLEWDRESLKAVEREEWPSSPVVDNYQEWLPCSSTRGISSFHSSGRKFSSLKTKIPYGQFIVPQNSLESCLMAHFYKKNEMECVSRSTSWSIPSTSHVFVNEDFQFDRPIRDDFSNLMVKCNKMQKEVFFEKKKHVHGVPQLPKIWSFKTPQKRNVTKGCIQDGNKYGYGKMVHPNRALDEAGSLGGSVLFCFGVSVGIISSLLSNKKEVDQLKEVLKQTVDLVQDLQEELEMKDSLTVQELINENCESTDTCGNSFPERTPDAFPTKLNRDNSTKIDGSESYDRKADESSDSMSKIEAELEAELERLGMGLATNTYNNEAIVSDLIELDPEFFDDFARGELIADINIEQSFTFAKPNRDAKYSTTYSGNFQVSPWELSVRLHEVIQSRLELRVNELETALQSSQKKVFMRSQSETLWRASSNSSKLPNSSKESPISNEKFNFTNQPLIKGLSGEARDAYNEAYKELTKMDDSEEEHTSSAFRTNNAQNPDEFHRSITFQRDAVRVSVPAELKNEKVPNLYEEQTSSDFRTNNPQNTNEFHRSITFQSDGSQVIEPSDTKNDKVPNFDVHKLAGDGEDDDDDEEEMDLIQKIVEKTRKGSPVVLHAQRWLFSLDEEEI